MRKCHLLLLACLLLFTGCNGAGTPLSGDIEMDAVSAMGVVDESPSPTPTAEPTPEPMPSAIEVPVITPRPTPDTEEFQDVQLFGTLTDITGATVPPQTIISETHTCLLRIKAYTEIVLDGFINDKEEMFKAFTKGSDKYGELYNAIQIVIGDSSIAPSGIWAEPHFLGASFAYSSVLYKMDNPDDAMAYVRDTALPDINAAIAYIESTYYEPQAD